MYKSGMETEIQYLGGVGPKRAALLRSELGVETVGDLVHLYPFRYIDRSTFHRIADLTPDMPFVQVLARVKSTELVGGKRLSVRVEDATGELELVFFKGLKYIKARLEPGAAFVFFGKPEAFKGRINLVHPEIDNPPAAGEQQPDGERTGVLTGVYPSTEKLKNAGITGKVMNKLMMGALNLALPEVEESLPDYIIREKGLVPLRFALRNIHFPTDKTALSKATYRLKFEELFFLQLSLLKQKYVRSRSVVGIPMPKVGDAFHACYDALPYELTGAQKRVIREIRTDLMSGAQMNRLLQGDVGSGKTMVAVLTALIAVGNGYQACIMAPTEVLAGILVGTHALIEDTVVFANLGLAIIDEQHRFGVEQRSKLWAKARTDVPPHVLVMTATPIPRTLAMTLYGDLDVSVIDEMPPGRKPVQTMLIGENRRQALWKFMREQIAAGRQVFVVYPLIFESDKVDYSNLEKGYEQVVAAFPFPPYKVAIVHGQQPNEEKLFNMNAFVGGRAHILVSTTVIEVGVDVPNASVMVIESAERFGLSQLHQLRGRVGRGSEKSYCILVKGQKVSRESQKRLDLMVATENGFELAEEDMKMRGPGDLEGTMQSGLPISLNIASLAKDGPLLSDARAYATHILDKDPSLELPENAPLVAELRKDKYFKRDYSKIS